MRAVVAMLVLLLGVGEASAQVFGRPCRCDCTGDGAVTVDELVLLANAALGGGLSCRSADADGSGDLAVDEVISCVQLALEGCPLVTRADAAFWDTLGLVADREEEALALHQQAVDADPGDAGSWFLLGMMRMYRYGKLLEDYSRPGAEAQQEVALANAALDQAVAADPEHRSYPGFRGAATYQNGVAQGDATLTELGLQQLRDAIELWPFFNRFSFLGTV
ncbi:MAG TPA: hypothetical protein VEB21_13450, partial [Terriglobales bacterium]|nr:hypothetical protein [Terriglobales bacterium]